jgi:hypothetical protein
MQVTITPISIPEETTALRTKQFSSIGLRVLPCSLDWERMEVIKSTYMAPSKPRVLAPFPTLIESGSEKTLYVFPQMPLVFAKRIQNWNVRIMK